MQIKQLFWRKCSQFLSLFFCFFYCAYSSSKKISLNSLTWPSQKICLSPRHRVTPALASCAVRLCSSSSSSEEQRWSKRASWKHVLAGLLAGSGAVLVYGLHQHKVTRGHMLWLLLVGDQAKFSSFCCVRNKHTLYCKKFRWKSTYNFTVITRLAFLAWVEGLKYKQVNNEFPNYFLQKCIF